MRTFLLGTLAAAVTLAPLSASVAEAAPPRRTVTTVRAHPNGRTVVTRRTTVRPHYRNWRKGERFDRRYARDYRTIDYRAYRGRGVYAPPRGYHWVRSGNDAVLVGIASGLIGAVVAGAIR